MRFPKQPRMLGPVGRIIHNQSTSQRGTSTCGTGTLVPWVGTFKDSKKRMDDGTRTIAELNPRGFPVSYTHLRAHETG